MTTLTMTVPMLSDDDHGVDSDSDSRCPMDTIVAPATGMTASEIARACRNAGVEFLNESKHWGKAELAMWLSGTYAMLTKHAGQEAKPAAFPVPLLRDIDARLIDRILESARNEILDTLRSVASDGSASFALRALISGTVVRCEDSFGEPAWAPTGEASRLADRVLSLFAVDYFAVPADYEQELVVCSQCASVSFDVSARKRGACPHHYVQQVASHRPAPRFTLPYPGLGA